MNIDFLFSLQRASDLFFLSSPPLLLFFPRPARTHHTTQHNTTQHNKKLDQKFSFYKRKPTTSASEKVFRR